MIALDILTDGFFAAVAGIGFGAISDPPLRAFKMIAILAALGHACRFCLMTYLGVDIATASLFAGLIIGFGSLKKIGMILSLGVVLAMRITRQPQLQEPQLFLHLRVLQQNRRDGLRGGENLHDVQQPHRSRKQPFRRPSLPCALQDLR